MACSAARRATRTPFFALRSVGILLALSFVAAPVVAGGPYVVHGTIGAADAPFVQMRSDRWIFDAVAGDIIEATLTWNDPSASLALEVVAPQFRCGNEECFTQLPEYVECDSLDNEPFTGTSRHVVIEATKTRDAFVFLSAEFSEGPVAYMLSFSVNGEAPTITRHDDEWTTTPHRQHACRAESAL